MGHAHQWPLMMCLEDEEEKKKDKKKKKQNEKKEKEKGKKFSMEECEWVSEWERTLLEG